MGPPSKPVRFSIAALVRGLGSQTQRQALHSTTGSGGGHNGRSLHRPLGAPLHWVRPHKVTLFKDSGAQHQPIPQCSAAEDGGVEGRGLIPKRHFHELLSILKVRQGLRVGNISSLKSSLCRSEILGSLSVNVTNLRKTAVGSQAYTVPAAEQTQVLLSS